MEIWKDYYKVLDVIDSCVTIEQLKCASKMLGFWLDKHMDYQVYNKTFKNRLKIKYKELNGHDFSELPYKSMLNY
jgi:hypothetical protein